MHTPATLPRADRAGSTPDPAPAPAPPAWLGTLLVAGIAGAMRLWDLGMPRAFLFDETYYAKQAWSLVNNGYAIGYVDDADERILAGDLTDLWTGVPDMVVHPEVGKWLIGAGELLAQMTPFGWRLPSALVGTLMVVVMIRLARRVTGSSGLGLIAGVLMTFDGLQFVLSRLALLDIFVAFFTLAAVAALVADRDRLKERLGERLGRQLRGRSRKRGSGDHRATVPVLWWRPWLLVSGVMWGLAIGTKWTALFPLALFGVWYWVEAARARRSAGVERAWLRSLLTDALPGAAYLVGVAFIVYVASWTGWLLHAGVYEEHLSHTQYGPYWGEYLTADSHGFVAEAIRALRSLWHYHHDVFSFHTRFLNDATHTYQSHPLGWPVMERPVGVDAQTEIAPGEQGCAAPQGSSCLRQILLLGTPLLWWFGSLAVIWSLVVWVLRRDGRHAIVVLGVLSAWLPWFRYDDRPIFVYYAIVFEPFIILAAVLLLGATLGPRTAGTRRRMVGAVAVGSIVLLVVVNFVWFWPIYTDGLLTHQEWLRRMWFHRWI